MSSSSYSAPSSPSYSLSQTLLDISALRSPLQDIQTTTIQVASKIISSHSYIQRPRVRKIGALQCPKMLGVLVQSYQPNDSYPQICLIPQRLSDFSRLDTILQDSKHSTSSELPISNHSLFTAVPLIDALPFTTPFKEIHHSPGSSFTLCASDITAASKRPTVQYKATLQDNLSFQSLDHFLREFSEINEGKFKIVRSEGIHCSEAKDRLLSEIDCSRLETPPFQKQVDLNQVAARSRTCNCKRSGCLKLYCVCFQSGGICGPNCGCIGCHNKKGCEEEIQKAKRFIMLRKSRTDEIKHLRRVKTQPEPPSQTDTQPIFDHSVSLQENQAPLEELKSQGTMQEQTVPQSPLKSFRGCNCKRSMCQKRYCECFARGSFCGANCSCLGCKNTVEAPSNTLTKSTSTGVMEGEINSFVSSPAILHPLFPQVKMLPQLQATSFSDRFDSISLDEKKVLTETNCKEEKQRRLLKRERKQKQKLKIRISRHPSLSQNMQSSENCELELE